MTQARRQFGARGEEAAAAWYAERGWTVVERNWRCREGEIDLIVRRRGQTVFCEVKARSSDRFGGAAAAVTPTKQSRIRRVAMRWLSTQSGKAGPVRFDVAVVEPEGLRLIEGAF